MRTAEIKRKTLETDIEVAIDLDMTGPAEIDTGIGFMNHMLELFARHSGFYVGVSAKGDLHVDDHHTVEDIGIVLGQALSEALGDKRGIERYGFYLVPMDEALVRVVVDLSGRYALNYDLNFSLERIGDLETECLKEFMIAFAQNAKMNLHITKLAGENNHHVAEAMFKALGRALKMAVKVGGSEIPSTKGTL